MKVKLTHRSFAKDCTGVKGQVIEVSAQTAKWLLDRKGAVPVDKPKGGADQAPLFLESEAPVVEAAVAPEPENAAVTTKKPRASSKRG